MCHKRSKHIESKYHLVREHANPGGEFRTATLIHVRTGEQPADIFTKALTETTFETHRRRLFGTERKSSTEVAKDSERKRRRAK